MGKHAYTTLNEKSRLLDDTKLTVRERRLADGSILIMLCVYGNTTEEAKNDLIYTFCRRTGFKLNNVSSKWSWKYLEHVLVAVDNVRQKDNTTKEVKYDIPINHYYDKTIKRHAWYCEFPFVEKQQYKWKIGDVNECLYANKPIYTPPREQSWFQLLLKPTIDSKLRPTVLSKLQFSKYKHI